ncbi:hypothetical protein CASFOL_002016 [Castilleja foliolosa]|uniref:CCT domain-containing protein n=1 Tax=Castilleja foliolosa TaxID=1961234 RepID=A0ABD3ED21_9LAMI
MEGVATAGGQDQQQPPPARVVERLNPAVQQQLNLESVKTRAISLFKAISRILEDFNAIGATNAVPKWPQGDYIELHRKRNGYRLDHFERKRKRERREPKKRSKIAQNQAAIDTQSILSSEMKHLAATGPCNSLQIHGGDNEVSPVVAVPGTGLGYFLDRCLASVPPLSVDEANFKVGRYNAEEKKERIDRYRAKRTQRNFNKTIKYACRKTLADSRPRVHGRFARNDETCEVPKASMFHRYKDDLWVVRWNGETAFLRGSHLQSRKAEQIKLATVKLAMKYMRRVSAELGMIGGSSWATLNKGFNRALGTLSAGALALGITAPLLDGAPHNTIIMLLTEGCYARLDIRAINCKKKKCGHINELRPKSKKGKFM